MRIVCIKVDLEIVLNSIEFRIIPQIVVRFVDFFQRFVDNVSGVSSGQFDGAEVLHIADVTVFSSKFTGTGR